MRTWSKFRRRRLRKIWLNAARAPIILLMIAWILAPFYFLGLLAIQSRAQALVTPPVWLPQPNMINFRHIFADALAGLPPVNASDLILPGIWNSAIVATVVALANVTLASGAAYAFARYRFPGNTTILVALLASQMVPVFVLLIPYFDLLRRLGLVNTRVGVMVAQLSFTLPFTIWLLRSYVASIPIDLDRAARVDGCSRFEVFWRVVLPLMRPGLISVGLFTFMVSWNDFLFPLVLNTDTSSVMIQPAIAGLYTIHEQSLGDMAAGSLLAALPTMLLALVAQRFLIRGFLAGMGKVV